MSEKDRERERHWSLLWSASLLVEFFRETKSMEFIHSFIYAFIAGIASKDYGDWEIPCFCCCCCRRSSCNNLSFTLEEITWCVLYHWNHRNFTEAKSAWILVIFIYRPLTHNCITNKSRNISNSQSQSVICMM